MGGWYRILNPPITAVEKELVLFLNYQLQKCGSIDLLIFESIVNHQPRYQALINKVFGQVPINFIIWYSDIFHTQGRIVQLASTQFSHILLLNEQELIYQFSQLSDYLSSINWNITELETTSPSDPVPVPLVVTETSENNKNTLDIGIEKEIINIITSKILAYGYVRHQEYILSSLPSSMKKYLINKYNKISEFLNSKKQEMNIRSIGHDYYRLQNPPILREETELVYRIHTLLNEESIYNVDSMEIVLIKPSIKYLTIIRVIFNNLLNFCLYYSNFFDLQQTYFLKLKHSVISNVFEKDKPVGRGVHVPQKTREAITTAQNETESDVKIPKERFLIDIINYIEKKESVTLTVLGSEFKKTKNILKQFNVKTFKDLFLLFHDVFEMNKDRVYLKSTSDREMYKFIYTKETFTDMDIMTIEGVICDYIRNNILCNGQVALYHVIEKKLTWYMREWILKHHINVKNFILKHINRLNIRDNRGVIRLIDTVISPTEISLLDFLNEFLDKNGGQSSIQKLNEAIRQMDPSYMSFLKEVFGGLDTFVLYYNSHFILHSKDKLVKKRNTILQRDWTLEKVKQEIDSGHLHVGVLKTHPRDLRKGFVFIAADNLDVIIDGYPNLYSSFDGDTVAIEIFPKEKWLHVEDETIDIEDESCIANNDEIDIKDDDEEDDKIDDPTEVDDMIKPVTVNTLSDVQSIPDIVIVEQTSNNNEVKIDEVTTTTVTTSTTVTPESNISSNVSYILKPTGRIVYIMKRGITHYVGSLVTRKSRKKRGQKMVLFRPKNRKLPLFDIDHREFPEDYMKNPSKYQDTLFTVQLKYWSRGSYPVGHNLQLFGGHTGELTTEIRALIFSYGVDTKELSIDSDIPKEFVIDEHELANRRDLREKRIFTIDPPTARDLDDALSVERLQNGNFEVGVHISDVTFFVKPNSVIDQIAQSRSTSIYLVNQVIPMLVPQLSEYLCSLNPKVPRYSVSIIWEMTPEGDIVNQWLGSTVIQSCVRLSYSDAQLVIDNKDKGIENIIKLSPQHQPEHIADDILTLFEISLKLKEKRSKNGRIPFETTRLYFELDDNGYPVSLSQSERNHANNLVEEFMLLANQSVAEFIYKHFPNQSFLRRNKNPEPSKIRLYVQYCRKFNVKIDTFSTEAIKQTLNGLSDNKLKQVLEYNLIRVMQKAEYFCSGDQSQHSFHHWALNVPFYTHFTSPIRRYADIMVHRLVKAALEGKPEEVLSPEKLSHIADHCTNQQIISKQVQNSCQYIYLGFFLDKCSYTDPYCIVINITKVIRIYSPSLGITCDVELSGFEMESLDKKVILRKKIPTPRKDTHTLKKKRRVTKDGKAKIPTYVPIIDSSPLPSLLPEHSPPLSYTFGSHVNSPEQPPPSVIEKIPIKNPDTPMDTYIMEKKDDHQKVVQQLEDVIAVNIPPNPQISGDIPSVDYHDDSGVNKDNNNNFPPPILDLPKVEAISVVSGDINNNDPLQSMDLPLTFDTQIVHDVPSMNDQSGVNKDNNNPSQDMDHLPIVELLSGVNNNLPSHVITDFSPQVKIYDGDINNNDPLQSMDLPLTFETQIVHDVPSMNDQSVTKKDNNSPPQAIDLPTVELLSGVNKDNNTVMDIPTTDVLNSQCEVNENSNPLSSQNNNDTIVISLISIVPATFIVKSYYPLIVVASLDVKSL